MGNIIITAENMSKIVTETLKKCFFEEGEDTSNFVKVEGISYIFGFHPERLEEQREIVTVLLAELPEEFKKGYSFLYLCKNKNGELWTDSQAVCEQLVVMAIGLDLMEYCLPREMWFILHGGVPYLIVK